MIFAGDGYVYTQVPFKSNDEGIYGLCAPTGAKNMKDSVAKIKCFYILLENYKKGERYEYLVTMIPAKQMETQGRDYDFLSKPNFTGLVIYSSLKGEYIREEIYKDGIVYNGKLWSVEEYRNVGKTKDVVVNGGTLKSITVVAHIPKRSYRTDNNIIYIPDIIGDPDVNNNDNTGPVKLESSIDPKTTGTNGKGGGALTPNLSCNINIEYLYCDSPQMVTTTVSKGGSWNATARDPNANCKFIMWYGDLSSSSRWIQVDSVQSDMSFFAKYVSSSNKKCFLIAQLLDAGYSRTAIASLLKIYTRDYEQSITVDEYNNYYITKGDGTHSYSAYDMFKNVKCVSCYHTHPDDCIPSDVDFFNFCDNIEHYSNPLTFSFGIISKRHEIFIMQIADYEKFKDFICEKKKSSDYKEAILNAWFFNVLKDLHGQINASDKLIKIGKFFDEIGLRYYILNSTPSTYNGTTYHWSSLNYINIEGTDDCFNH